MSDDTLYEGPERRVGMTEERLAKLLDEANTRQAEQLREYINQEIQETQELIKSAFPNGDTAAHRIAHEAQIKRSDRWEAMKAEFITKAFTGGMYAAGAFLLVALWEYIKVELRR